MIEAKSERFCQKVEVQIIDSSKGSSYFLKYVKKKRNVSVCEKSLLCIMEKWSVSPLKASVEMVENFELKAAYLSKDIVDAYKKYLKFPTKRENKLNSVLIYGIQTFNRKRTRPYSFSFYTVAETMGLYGWGWLSLSRD